MAYVGIVAPKLGRVALPVFGTPFAIGPVLTPTTPVSSIVDRNVTYTAQSVAPAGQYLNGDWFWQGATVTADAPASVVQAAGTWLFATPESVTFQDVGETVTALNSAGNAADTKLVNGQKVRFTSLTGVVGVVTNTDYFVVNKSGNTFQISATNGGAVITLSADGTGVMRRYGTQDRAINGLMVDPQQTGAGGSTGNPQGFDGVSSIDAWTGSSLQSYATAQNVSGSTITGSKSLVKGISVIQPNSDGRESLTDMSLLTLVSAVPPNQSFRPHPSDTDKTPTFALSDVDLSILPSLTAPSGGNLGAATDLIKKLGPLQTFFTNNLFTRSINAVNQQSSYGSDIANDVARAILFCCSTASGTDKALVANYLIQAGLDVWRRTANGGRWPSLNGSYGGGQHWIKGLVVFAQRMLRNSTKTANLASLTQYADFAQRPYYTEDFTINLITRANIGTTPRKPDAGYGRAQYQNYMENTPDWNSKPSDLAFAGFGNTEKYRYVNNGVAGIVAGLLQISGSRAAWNNDPFFVFYDRWVNWWRGAGKPVTSYAPSDIAAWIDAYWPIYTTAAANVVRTVARDNYVWVEFDKLLDMASVSASSAFALTVNGTAQTLTNPSTTCAVVAGSANVTVASSSGFVAGQSITCPKFTLGTRILSIAGNVLSLSEMPISAGTSQPITATNVNVFGYSLAIALPATLAGGEAVVFSYTVPGTNPIRTIGGTSVAAMASVSATNLTGVLPAGATTIERVRNGTTASLATRQYARAIAPQDTTASISKLLIGQRFRLYSRTLGDTLLANATGTSGAFRSYMATLTDWRTLVLGQQLRMAGILSAADEGTDVTLWQAFDWTKTSQTGAGVASQANGVPGSTPNDVLRASKNGVIVYPTASTTATTTGTATFAPATLFSSGIGLFANPGIIENGGTNISDAAHLWTWIDWGGAGFTLPTDLSAAPFSGTAAPGANGESVTGTPPRYFYAGTVDEANAQGMANRGRGPVASMVAQATYADGDDTTPYPYVLGG